MDSVFWFLLDMLPWWIIAAATLAAAWATHRTLGWRAAVGGIVVGLALIFTKRTYEKGRQDSEDRIDRRTDKLREDFNEIDREHTDPDDAYNHLRGLQPPRRD